MAILFTRHELWTVRACLDVPPVALFVFTVFSVPWMLLLSIPLALIAVPTLQFEFLPGLILMGVLGLVLLVPIAAWFFDWYFIVVALFFRGKDMAERKERKVLARLERLQ